MHNALVLDDSTTDLSTALTVLATHMYNPAGTASISLARTLVTSVQFDVIVSDINITWPNGPKGIDLGVGFAKLVLQHRPRTHVILWGQSTEHHAAAAAVGAKYITKRQYVESRLGDLLRDLRAGV